MSVAKINLDESTTLEFGVSITGASGKPESRFVIDGKDFSVSFPAKETNEGVEVYIKGLKNVFDAGEYDARLEVILENKIYTPLIDKIEILPDIKIVTKSRVIEPVKESVKVKKITVIKPVINEKLLQKIQAATIIADAFGYVPNKNLTPTEIVNQTLESIEEITDTQLATIKDMLELVESFGIEYNKDLIPVIEAEVTKVEEITPEIKEPKVEPDTTTKEDGLSDTELENIADTIDDWEDIVDVYEPGELHIIDDETGEEIDDLKDDLKEDSINEVLSRIERIRAKVRFHKSAAKRTRKLKISLKHHSTNAQINSRARKLAIKLLKTKLAKKPLNKLNTGEKEQLERIIKSRGKLVNRLAMKLVVRVKNIEKKRLSH